MFKQVVLVTDQSMMLVRILLALLNSKLDPYGANLLIGKIFLLTNLVQKGPQDILMLIITFKRFYFTSQIPTVH